MQWSPGLTGRPEGGAVRDMLTFRPRWVRFLAISYAGCLLILFLFGVLTDWNVHRVSPVHWDMGMWLAQAIIAAVVAVVAAATVAAMRSWLVRLSDAGLDIMMLQPVRISWDAVQTVEVTDTRLRVALRPSPTVRYLRSLRQPRRQPFRELRISLRLLGTDRADRLRTEVDRRLRTNGYTRVPDDVH
jgi:hypothetical protein